MPLIQEALGELALEARRREDVAEMELERKTFEEPNGVTLSPLGPFGWPGRLATAPRSLDSGRAEGPVEGHQRPGAVWPD